MTAKDIKYILDKHLEWLKNGDCGKPADLQGANLRGADLQGANLIYADLRGADLRNAILGCAIMVGADLRGADLMGAYLQGADLRDANLRGADLQGADLRGADLRIAKLIGADLRIANLIGANLGSADLQGADLHDADLPPELLAKLAPLCCPERGSFIGWKKCGEYIVKLKVTDTAKRSSAFGRKCRCSEAVVLDIEQMNGEPGDVTSVASNYSSGFIYTIGETVRVDNFDDNRTHECAPGIHFFITRQEAVEYGLA